MGNTPSSLATFTKQDTCRSDSRPSSIVSTNRDDIVATEKNSAFSPTVDDIFNSSLNGTTNGTRNTHTAQTTSQTKVERTKRVQQRNRKRAANTVINDANDGGQFAAVEQATPRYNIEQNKKVRRQRKRKRAAMGFLPKRFKYLPLNLKMSMRKAYKMYAPQTDRLNQQDATSISSQASHTPMTPTSMHTFVVKKTQPVQRKSKRRPQVAVHPEVLSTHPTAWEANCAVLQFLHESCGPEAWDLTPCCMCGSAGREYLYWWIDGQDGCLKAGFARRDATDEEVVGEVEEWGNDNDEILWQGWVVERKEVES